MPTNLKRVTFAEDNPDIVAVVKFVLNRTTGFKLDVCKDGYEVVRRAPGFKLEIIILDVMMPGLDGIKACQKLRSMPQFAATPIAFMTARAMKDEVDDYLSLGASAVIPKPFDPLTLPSQINAIVQAGRS